MCVCRLNRGPGNLHKEIKCCLGLVNKPPLIRSKIYAFKITHKGIPHNNIIHNVWDGEVNLLNGREFTKEICDYFNNYNFEIITSRVTILFCTPLKRS